MFDLIGACAFTALEFLFPGSGSRYFLMRKEVAQDLLWYGTNEVVGRGISFALWVVLIPRWHFHPVRGEWLTTLPLAIQFLIALLLVDLCSWSTHFLIHRVPVLWRFHKLHHSSEQVDWLAGFRSYWLDAMTLDFFGTIPLLLLPFDSKALVILGVWISASTFITHANFGFRIPLISDWVNTWSSHRVHHLSTMKYPYGQNFGGYTMIWDRLMGTYWSELEVPAEKRKYGLPDGDPYPSGWLNRIAYPFRRSS